MNLSVGDVVFVLDKKTQSVVPCQLVERISSVTLEGEKIKNIASTPSGKTFVLEEYDSTWFESYRQAHEYLSEAAMKLVEATMNRARVQAEKSFKYSFKTLEVTPTKPIQEALEEIEEVQQVSGEKEQVFVDMGGQKVKVTLPKEYVINE